MNKLEQKAQDIRNRRLRQIKDVETVFDWILDMSDLKTTNGQYGPIYVFKSDENLVKVKDTECSCFIPSGDVKDMMKFFIVLKDFINKQEGYFARIENEMLVVTM